MKLDGARCGIRPPGVHLPMPYLVAGGTGPFRGEPTPEDEPALPSRKASVAIAGSSAGEGGAVLEGLGERLARLRRARGIPTRAMSMRLGCDHSLVVRWERATREPTF